MDIRFWSGIAMAITGTGLAVLIWVAMRFEQAAVRKGRREPWLDPLYSATQSLFWLAAACWVITYIYA